MVAKQLTGSQGTGVSILETPLSANTTLESFHRGNIPVKLQRFIKAATNSVGQATDIRAIVIGDRVVCAMERTANGGDFRANLSRGGSGRQHVACPQLTRQILELVAQREAVWDKKRFLERNRYLPAEPIADVPTDLPQLSGDGDAKPGEARYELAYQKRRLIDQKSKLKRKLENPKARPSKRVEWETELAQCEHKIREIEFQLS